MATFTWKNENVPAELKITQVYGVIFSPDGRVLLIDDGGRFSLIGGHPEEYDMGIAETLRREVSEEANVGIFAPVFVGYQEVDEENGKAPYAQVRMTAMIDKVGESRPDPDNGKTYGRLLAPPTRAAELLGWGEIAHKQIGAALEIAKREFCFGALCEKEEYI